VAIYQESWKVWIDFNKNGSFADPGEEVVSYLSSQIGWETSTFTVPATAVSGPTVMRVSMKNNAAQTSCEVFARGEVEDYTVNIGSLTGVTNTASVNNFSASYQRETNAVTVSCPALSGYSYELAILDLEGRAVAKASGKVSAHFNSVLHLPEIAAGIYFVSLKSDTDNFNQRLLISK